MNIRNLLSGIVYVTAIVASISIGVYLCSGTSSKVEEQSEQNLSRLHLEDGVYKGTIFKREVRYVVNNEDNRCTLLFFEQNHPMTIFMDEKCDRTLDAVVFEGDVFPREHFNEKETAAFDSALEMAQYKVAKPENKL